MINRDNYASYKSEQRQLLLDFLYYLKKENVNSEINVKIIELEFALKQIYDSYFNAILNKLNHDEIH